MTGKKVGIARKITLYFIVTVLIIWVMFPLYWITLTSFKNEAEWKRVPPVYITTQPNLRSYEIVYHNYLFPAFYNGMIVAVASTILSIVLGSLAAYALARYDFKGKDNVAFWILSMRMLLPVAVIIPFFMLMRQLRLIDNLLSLVLIHTAFNLPFSVWILRGYFLEIPKEMEESAMVNGCSGVGVLARILMPICAPGVLVTAIFCFIFSWNEFLFALILTQRAALTMPVQLSKLHQTRGPLWGQIGALGVLAIVPALILTLLIQKHLVRGLSFGALKE